MCAQYVDRYARFRVDNKIKPLPRINIPISDSDKYAVYKEGDSRLDKLSNQYYLNPYSGWLILLANPEYGGLEFNIPDQTSIRIPFPFNDALNRYNIEIINYQALYG